MRLVFYLYILSNGVMAQSNWSSGSIVLKDQKVRVGKIQFHADVLLMKAEDQVVVYPAYQISSFRFYDVKANINRHYLSLSRPGSVFPVLQFYEVVTWGEVSVIRRSNYSLLNNVDEKDYAYFSWQENKLTPLKKFRSDIYPVLQQQYALQLKEFMITQNLNPNRIADVIRIVKFCNQQAHARISMAAL